MTRSGRPLRVMIVSVAGGVCLACGGCDDPTDSGLPPGALVQELVVPVSGGFTTARPALDATRMYADLGSPGIVAIDRGTGDEIWRRERTRYTPDNLILENDLLLFAGGDATALDPGAGSLAWRFEPTGEFDEVPGFGAAAAGNGAVFFGAGREVFSVDATDGSLLWRTNVGAEWEHRAIGWGAAVAGDTVYASIERYLSPTGHIGRAYLVALDAATGEILWTFTDSDGVGPRQFLEPHVAGELVLVGDNMNNTYIAVDRWSGEERWRVLGERGWFGPFKSPVVSNDTAFGGSADRWATAMDLHTGEVIWETHFGGSLWRGVELCGSRVLTWDTPLRVLDRATGELLESLDLYGEYGSLIRSITVDPETNQAYVLGSKHLFVFRCPS